MSDKDQLLQLGRLGPVICLTEKLVAIRWISCSVSTYFLFARTISLSATVCVLPVCGNYELMC